LSEATVPGIEQIRITFLGAHFFAD